MRRRGGWLMLVTGTAVPLFCVVVLVVVVVASSSVLTRLAGGEFGVLSSVVMLRRVV